STDLILYSSRVRFPSRALKNLFSEKVFLFPKRKQNNAALKKFVPHQPGTAKSVTASKSFNLQKSAEITASCELFTEIVNKHIPVLAANKQQLQSQNTTFFLTLHNRTMFF
ncbi:MAG: hypothetical protein NC131_12540, partial [Roseburia sp.]|nr:hypothetical protein [Roseburia sp.]